MSKPVMSVSCPDNLKSKFREYRTKLLALLVDKWGMTYKASKLVQMLFMNSEVWTAYDLHDFVSRELSKGKDSKYIIIKLEENKNVN